MTLEEWNKTQVYIYKKFEIDPKDLKTIISIATCIGCFRDEVFTLDLLNEIENVIEKLIKLIEGE